MKVYMQFFNRTCAVLIWVRAWPGKKLGSFISPPNQFLGKSVRIEISRQNFEQLKMALRWTRTYSSCSDVRLPISYKVPVL